MSVLTRRAIIQSLAISVLRGAAAGDRLQPIVNYWESLARPGGGYGWPDNPDSALSVTYAAIASYRLLGVEPPRKAELARFLREGYPMDPPRRKDRPLHRYDYEQAQSLAWLGEPLDEFRTGAAEWVKPSYFTNRYEFHENPLLQQETGAILCRKLLGLPPTDAWIQYIGSRRRPNGSFNHTPGNDGADGHVVNTLWGLLALQALGAPVDRKRETAAWIRSCQLPGGGFTWAPHPKIAGHDHVAYTWAALMALPLVDSTAGDAEAARKYLLSLWNEDGGFGDRPGRMSNPLATHEALEALSALGPIARIGGSPRHKTVSSASVPSNLKVFTMQIEAPGKGNPRETVAMARALGIHLWGAKNSEPGWIEAVQQVAREEKAPVTFFVANEEYGTYVSVPGLGTYSHLADITAPAGSDFGKAMADDKHPNAWDDFLRRRIDPLRRAGGSNVWQFNENEELTRVLLDQAVESGTFSSISSFHFGNENFLVTQPFLNRYRDVLPFIGLQDAHSQTWWWMEYLTAFRTLFLATEPTWDGWRKALEKNWIVSVRHDSRTNFKTQVAGASNAVRKYVMDRAAGWRWWGDKPDQMRRPWASISAIGPNDKFDEIKVESGVVLRVRCWMDTKPAGVPKDPVTELVSLEVDGRRVMTKHVAERADIYDRYDVPADQKGRHTAVATIRMIKTGELSQITTEF
jgi:prenyltransferase beta subunit